MVRVDLAGRRIGGWVTDIDVDPPDGVEPKPVARLSPGPEPHLVDLAGWAARRWAGRRAALLATASPKRPVPALPAPALRPPSAPPSAVLPDLAVPSDGTVVTRLAPAVDLTPVVAAVAQRGPTLVVVPSLDRAGVLASRLRRAGADVALLPDGWAQARAGAAVVVGARAAAWAPCPGLAAVVVVDGHDESLVQEQSPTWSAVAVAAERARRAGVPCVITTPCPTATLLDLGPVVAAGDERAGWARLEVVDMRAEDPRAGLWSASLVRLARGAGKLVVVLNRTGRARLVTCAACSSVARCERCGAAVSAALDDSRGAEVLACPRCSLTRPMVCAQCGSTGLRRLRIGVGRAREQLESLAGRAVGEVTSATTEVPSAPVLVGTSAVLHRVERCDAVAFVDFDAQLLAPRYRAGEDAIALLARASRLLGGRHRPGTRVVVQTRMPDHPVVDAARRGDPSGLAEAELALRRQLGLPPAAALAAVSGAAGASYVGALAGVEVVGVGADRWVVAAATHAQLSDALGAVARPPGRMRVDVDPLEL